MIKILILIAASLLAMPMGAQKKKEFTVVRQLPITSVKNQYRSGTCWDYATLGFLESEILRKTGKTYDLCEMFVVSKDYMDCATHYVRMHGYSQMSEGGSCDDVLEVIRQYGICPEDAMPAPGSLTGDSLANFKVFFPELERTVSSIVRANADLNRITESEQKQSLAKQPKPHWRDSVQAVIEKYVGRCPETFVYKGKAYTPRDYMSLNTTYLFLNRHALPKALQKALMKSDFNR